MSARINTTGEYYARLGFGTGNFSACYWMRPTIVTRWTGVMNLDNGANYLYVGFTDSSQPFLEVSGTYHQFGGTNLIANTWYGVSIIRDTVPATNTHDYRIYDTSMNIFNSRNVNSNNIIGADLRFGTSQSFSADFINGRIAALKIWSAVLSQAELENELNYFMPLRTANIFSITPFFDVDTDTIDWSGNGNLWTRNGVITYEDSPPIKWSIQHLTLAKISSNGVPPDPEPIVQQNTVQQYSFMHN